jgi:integrase
VSDWLTLRLIDITETMVAERYRTLTARVPSAGHNAFRKLRTLFFFAMRHYRIEEREGQESTPVITMNPVCILTKNKVWKKQKRRKTVIPRKKLGTWFHAVLDLRKKTPVEHKRTICDYFLTLLMTGMREKECAKLEWKHVDLEMGIITLIAKNTKARRQHDLPLSDYLWSLLKERHERRQSRFVFPSALTNDKHLAGSESVMQEIIRKTKITFCHHDLRRTFTSIAEYIGTPNFTIKRLLNHVIDNDTTGGYISEFFDDEGLRRPMQCITDFILGEVGIKEPVHATMQYVPMRTSDYLTLQLLAKQRAISLEEMVSLMIEGFDREHRDQTEVSARTSADEERVKTETDTSPAHPHLRLVGGGMIT